MKLSTNGWAAYRQQIDQGGYRLPYDWREHAAHVADRIESDFDVPLIHIASATAAAIRAHLSAMKDGETMKIPQYSL